jgi:predicted ArsR family transcriptional regulator
MIPTICAARASTVTELADALGLAAATVRGHCDRLVAAGTLVVDVAGSYRRGNAVP